jgi:hypothetical protein
MNRIEHHRVGGTYFPLQPARELAIRHSAKVSRCRRRELQGKCRFADLLTRFEWAEVNRQGFLHSQSATRSNESGSLSFNATSVSPNQWNGQFVVSRSTPILLPLKVG